VPKTLHIRVRRDDSDIHIIASCYNFAKVVRDIIRAHMNNEKSVINLPPAFTFPKEELTDKVFSVQLLEKRDDDIIEFLRTVPRGRANAFFKALIRNAISKESIKVCIETADEEQRNSPVFISLFQQFLANMDVKKLLASENSATAGTPLHTMIADSFGKNDVQDILLQKPHASRVPAPKDTEDANESPSLKPQFSSGFFGNSDDTDDLMAFDF